MVAWSGSGLSLSCGRLAGRQAGRQTGCQTRRPDVRADRRGEREQAAEIGAGNKLTIDSFVIPTHTRKMVFALYFPSDSYVSRAVVLGGREEESGWGRFFFFFFFFLVDGTCQFVQVDGETVERYI